MKLSIFPKCKALPSKEEKGSEARFTSKPYFPEVVEFTTDEDLIEIICNNAWSPSIFQEFRRQDGFLSTDLIVLDIDDKMTIPEAEKVAQDIVTHLGEDRLRMKLNPFHYEIPVAHPHDLPGVGMCGDQKAGGLGPRLYRQ